MGQHHVHKSGSGLSEGFAIKPDEQPSDDIERDAEKYSEAHSASPEDVLLADGEPPHDMSLTACAAEALRTGLYPQREEEEIPGQDELLRAGDPDSDPLENLYSGEELPGGSATSPDQGGIDELGRLAGVVNSDRGELRAAEEIAERRDRHRWEQLPNHKARRHAV